jgi:GNAT superfamily N-acetyltransferase
VDSFRIRELRAQDRPVISTLLDAALGGGFWDADDLACEVARVADAGATPIGVGTASLDRTDEGLVGHIRLVAVDPAWRRRGVATGLIQELVDRCEALGATSHVTYAWVHGPGGTAPLARVLIAAGFSLSHRIESLYSHIVGASCPACGHSPCVCPADLYVREAISTGSQQTLSADAQES